MASAAVCVAAAAAAAAVYTYYTFDPRWWWKRRGRSPLEVNKRPGWEESLIHGFAKPGWEAVREEFVENFRRRGELGAAICVRFQGEVVVDLWGGYRDRAAQSEWERKTLVPIFSATKGVSAIAVALQHSRGKIGFDSRVADYWPEFAQNGKGEVTVRQLLDHACGLAGPSPPIALDTLADKDATRAFFAAVKMEPDWAPGDKKGYMAVTLGNYESALVQATDDDGARRSAGEFLRDEVFTPLGVQSEFFVGVGVKELPDERFAQLDGMSGLEPLWVTSYPPGFMRRMLLQPGSYTARAFANPRLSAMTSVLDFNRRKVKEVEFPAANGQATARALAAIYSAAERAASTDGRDNPLGLAPDTLRELMAPARPARLTGWHDEILGMDMAMSLGMLKPPPPGSAPGRFSAFGADSRAFGTPGAGGSFAFCDPAAELAFAYVMNRCGSYIVDDPREFALRVKTYECAHRARLRSDAEAAPLPLDRLAVAHELVAKDLEQFPWLAPLPPVAVPGRE